MFNNFLFIRLLQEGGTGMYFILLAFLLSLIFIVMAFVKRHNHIEISHKMIRLASETSIIALVLGCLCSMLGVINLFDMVEALGNVAPYIYSAGLKVSMLTITFGLFSFTFARIGILIYKWGSKPI